MSRRRLKTTLGGVTTTNFIVLTLAYVLFGNTVLEARARASAGVESKPTVPERILEVPQGATIEVHLLNKQKLKGRLGEVTSDAFNLQTAQGNKIETQKIAFADVKSFKQVGETTAKKASNRVIWILAGIGVFIGVLIIVGVTAASQ